MGGAHLAHKACIAGNVTPYSLRKTIKYTFHRSIKQKFYCEQFMLLRTSVKVINLDIIISYVPQINPQQLEEPLMHQHVVQLRKESIS